MPEPTLASSVTKSAEPVRLFAFDVTCPRCGAPARSRCRNLLRYGVVATQGLHPERARAARAVREGEA